MGRGIIKLNDGERDWYLEWSTIVDAPITNGMTLDELQEHIREEYGEEGLRRLAPRMLRVHEKGTSFIRDDSAQDTIDGNRAGRKEKCLTEAEIIDAFCLRPNAR